MAITKGDPDPAGYTVASEVAGHRPSGLISEMYDTYRTSYDGSGETPVDPPDPNDPEEPVPVLHPPLNFRITSPRIHTGNNLSGMMVN